MNRKFQFEDYKKCLEPTQIKISYTILKKKNDIKNKQRFKREKNKVFTEEINNKSIIQTYWDGTGKDLVSEKEEIECDNIIK